MEFFTFECNEGALMLTRSFLFLFSLSAVVGVLLGLLIFGSMSVQFFSVLTRESIIYSLLFGVITGAFVVISLRRSLPQTLTILIVFDHPAQFIERMTSLLSHKGYICHQHQDNMYTFTPDLRRSRFLEKLLLAMFDPSYFQIVVQVRTESAHITGSKLLRGFLQTLQRQLVAS